MHQFYYYVVVLKIFKQGKYQATMEQITKQYKNYTWDYYNTL